MTDSVVGMLLLVGLTVAMVALAGAALRPSRASVWTGVAGLALLPAVFVVLALVVWAMGR